MSRPRATKAGYKDVEPLWWAATNNGGALIHAASQQAATQIVQRLHQYRVLDRQEGIGNESMLDFYVVKRLSPTTIEITLRQVEARVLTPAGEHVDMDEIQQQIDSFNKYKADQDIAARGIITPKQPVEPPPDPYDPNAPLSVETC